MNKISLIIRKNFLILAKSKFWILVVIISPLLVIFLTGIAFDNLNQYKINIGVYSQDYNQFTNSFIAKLNTDQFRTLKAKSEEECIDDVKIGLSHTCVIFPPNLTLGSKNKDIVIFIDYSKLNLAWILKDQLFSRVEQRSTEITKELTQNILSKLLITRNEVSSDILLVALIKINNEGISNKTSEAYYLVVSINTTIGLNESEIKKLESKISSLKAANDLAIKEAERTADLAEDLVNKGDFTSDDEEEYLDNINHQRSIIKGQQNYILQLFDKAYSGSINATIGNIIIKVNEINKNALSNDVLKENATTKIYNINELTASNAKSVAKLGFSLEEVRKLLASIDELQAEDIASPVIVDIKPLTSYNTNLNYIFPTLMAISIMLAALLLSAIVVVMELNSPAFFRNYISPTSSMLFFISSYLTNLSLIGVQVFLMIGISIIFFFTQVISNIFTTLIVSLFISTFFILLGMGIGYLLKSEQMSILAANFTASIFLFLSNVLLPIENMPELFMKIVQFNPFIISVSLLRKSILFKQNIIDVNGEILILVIFTLVLLALYAGMHFLRRNKIVKQD